MSEFSAWPRFDKMPDSAAVPLGQFRIYRRVYGGGFRGHHEDTLECLFEDGFGSRFWAPVPVFAERIEQPASSLS